MLSRHCCVSVGSLVHISQWSWKVGEVFIWFNKTNIQTLLLLNPDGFQRMIWEMNPENLALAQEEATLTKIRNFLNSQKVKLWEPPYYDPVRKTPNEVQL